MTAIVLRASKQNGLEFVFHKIEVQPLKFQGVN
jgi:hypothetical protein